MTNTRNRWLYATGAAVACAAVLITANVALGARNPAPGTSSFVAGAPAPAPAPSKSKPAAAAPDRAGSPAVIRTGIKVGDGEWVLYAEPIDEEAIPQITFGIMLGFKAGGKEPVDAVMSNETSGPEKAPGFHAVQGGMQIEQGVTPTFGYYVGPAAKITGKVGGKKVTASRAPLDESMQVFWFDATGLSGLAAYDADGKKLPTGNAGIGVG